VVVMFFSVFVVVMVSVSVTAFAVNLAPGEPCHFPQKHFRV
jgi:hypothetical protein